MAPAQLHVALATLIEISSPKGAPWEFLVIFATVLLGPIVLERARAPGIVGLLLGGYVIGPHGLDLIGSGNTTVPDLGQLGLLYLMFVAGVELDLNLLRRHRRAAVLFGLMTFALPMLFGTGVGLGLGWETLAALLLGSLLASHTLITYPTVRDAGLASDPAVASAVGSTVLTDTLALVVLAAVAGSAGAGRSTFDVAVQLIVGLAVLIAFSLLVLPVLAAWAFRLFGAERSVRYVVAITAFLAAATVAELFGIEGIVGAFFAGLALNRLVPNEGQLMDRIGFFGGAVFIPVFLVSVGLILNPAVIVKGQTLGYAALFIAACLGGKILAAGISSRLLGFSRPQTELLFSLSAAQAAATLAATVVGFQIGLFSGTVVNAVLILIFVSVLVSTLLANRATSRLATRELGPTPLGARVIVGVGDPELAAGALAIAVRVARADGGVVHPVLVVALSQPFTPRGAHRRLTQAAAAAGVDGVVSTVVDRSVLHGALHAGMAIEATLVLVAEPREVDASERAAARRLLADAGPSAPAVATVRGNAGRLGAVRTLVFTGEGDSVQDDASPRENAAMPNGTATADSAPSAPDLAATSLATELARRVARRPADPLPGGEQDWSALLAPEDVTFLPAGDDASTYTLPTDVPGMLVTTLAEQTR